MFNSDRKIIEINNVYSSTVARTIKFGIPLYDSLTVLKKLPKCNIGWSGRFFISANFCQNNDQYEILKLFDL